MTDTPPVVAAGGPAVGAGSGRDPSTGRWLPGHAKAGGRKRGVLELRSVVADELGEDQARTDLVAAYKAVAALAAKGDVQAARLLFERLCGPLALVAKVDVATDAEPRSNEELARELTSILALACHGRRDFAAELVAVVLRGVGDQDLAEFADALKKHLVPDSHE